MPVSVTDVVGGFLAPAIFAGVVMVVLHRLLPEKIADRFAATVALVGGFTLGYALLGLGQWSPKFFWHWLPYVTLATLPVGPLLAGTGKQRIAGGVLMLGVAVLGGWLLTPTWPHLEPSRAVYMAVWIPAAFTLAILLNPLTRNEFANILPKRLLACTLTTAMFFAVVIIFLSGSLRFTQLAGAAAAAMLGMSLAVLFDRKCDGVPGIAPTCALLIGGLLFVAQVDSHSSVPLVSYILIPLAPLALWLGAIKPLRGLTGPRRWLVLSPLPVALLLISLIMALVAEFTAESSW